MHHHLYLFSAALLLSSVCRAQANLFPIVGKTQKAVIVYSKGANALDSIAAHLLAEDIERVTSFKPAVLTDISKARGNVIVIGNIQSPLIQKIAGTRTAFSKKLRGQWECFGLRVVDNPMAGVSKALVIAGSDPRGTAYGVFTLSEKIGLSPWYWWADAPVKHQKELSIAGEEYISSPPAVKYRGIFINDEDWGLQPWAAKTFEPQTGDIGPATYAKVFELLLRLKANLIWPAMHPSTKAFFHYPGNIKAAGDYQIIIGSSHAEPMLRNNVSEWNVKSMGHFNYLTNKESVLKYWEQRVKESSHINTIYTIGMRGIHDGQMEGVKDLKEAVPLVERIFADERNLLAKYVNKDITKIPQVLVPYKEVLEIYDNGLQVPRDVTLVWPDDNYGYIQRLNNDKEEARPGGAGVYYHASYWGRPHDYLWLPSVHPSLMREEMMKAYATGADRLWILNVGDIKPQEYNMQEFLDMAYNPAPFRDSRYPKQHLLKWAGAIFGHEHAEKIQSILWKYYELAFERKPEFMGWSQTEPETGTTYTALNHFYFGDEGQKRLYMYDSLEKEAKQLRHLISPNSADAFYELVYYPVVSASWINKKFLYRDKSYFYSLQNRLSAYDYAGLSKAVYDSIVKETAYYNTQLVGGKWKNMMTMNPRDLAVFQAPAPPQITTDSTNSWGIAPEGYVTKDSSLSGNNDSLRLPLFDNLNKQRYFVDIYLQKNQTVSWTADVSQQWIRLTRAKGELNSTMKEERVWVDIDWSKAPGDEQLNGHINFAEAGRKIIVQIRAINRNKAALTGYQGFIENNGFVSMHATNFSRQITTSFNRWAAIHDLGYTGNGLQALPISTNGRVFTDPDSIRKNSAHAEYDFYTFSPAPPLVTIYALPAYPINNDFSARYAVSIDNGPLVSADIKTFGRSEEWKQNVLRNRAERTMTMPYLHAGKHVLKVYCVDPGLILDEIRIDLGGLKKAYGPLPETKIATTSSSVVPK